MKRFVTKKRILVLRYKLIYIFTFSIIFLIIVGNIVITLFLKNINFDMMNLNIHKNLYGLNFFDNNRYNTFLEKNLYGLKLNKDKMVINNKANFTDIIIDNSPLIYIYNTFQTDKYKSNHYNSYNINSFVTQASKILSENLKKYNISSIVENKSIAKVLKDNNIPYTNSYKASRILLDEAYQNNKSLKYFFDIQVSSNKYQNTTVNINGENYAKILFIVGTLNNNYKENQRLAIAIENIIQSKNKDISLGVSLRGGAGYHGIYNQDFNNNTLLIQIGGFQNTIDEVNNTLHVLAEAINEYLEENNEKK